MAENDQASSDAPEVETGTESAAEASATTAAAAGGGDDDPTTAAAPQQTEAPSEEITYHAVEKDGQVTAIWEMQGRKHLRTIDPRSRQGQEILRLYTAEHAEEHAGEAQ